MSQRLRRIAVGAGTLALAGVALGPGLAQDARSTAEATYSDIQQTLGLVPGFFRQFSAAGIAGAWAEFKGVQLNPKTELSGKVKELIGLAVAAQVPCTYCVYFHTQAAKANGATEGEIREAIAMAAITRHWSTVLNGAQIDFAAFKQEADTVLRIAGERAKTAATAKRPK